MPKSTRSIARIFAAVTMVVVAAAVAGAAAMPMPAMALTLPTSATTKTVTYLGHDFTVPSAWPVVDLTQDPTACVEFDKNVVYLGTPGENQDCPSVVLGKADALLIQPAETGTTAGFGPSASTRTATAGATAISPSESTGIRQNTVEHQITSVAGGVSVTASYFSTPTEVMSILADAGMTNAPAPTANMVHADLAIVPDTSIVARSSTSYTSVAFDPCAAPSTDAMSAWKAASPYGAIGIYIGGVNEGCSQPNLTANWVTTEAAAGWHFFLLYVGPQAPHNNTCPTTCTLITSPVSQAQSAAQDAATQAQNLGFGPGTPIVYDMEDYAPAGRSAVLPFMSQWTTSLHALGYKSGEYSSVNSGIQDLVNNASAYAMPDVIDFANWNGSESTSDASIPATVWSAHQRIHQYSGRTTQTFGGFTLNIDGDFMDVNVLGSAPPMPAGGTLGDVTGDAAPDLLVVDPGGELLLYPNSRLAAPDTFNVAPMQVGSAWTGYTIDAVADLYHSGRAGILATNPDGNLYYYPNSGGSGLKTFSADTEVGTGWGAYDIVGLADLYGTGKDGILTIDSTGALLFYPNTGGSGTSTFGKPVAVGLGWTGFTTDVADLNGDGKPDLLAVNSAGALLYYPNTGGSGTSTFGKPVTVGSGWTGFQAVDVAKISGSIGSIGSVSAAGRTGASIVAIDPSGNLLLYPNTVGTGSAGPMFGADIRIGSAWTGLTVN